MWKITFFQKQAGIRSRVCVEDFSVITRQALVKASFFAAFPLFVCELSGLKHVNVLKSGKFFKNVITTGEVVLCIVIHDWDQNFEHAF